LERFEKILFKGVHPKNYDGLLKQQRETLLEELAEGNPDIESVFELEVEPNGDANSAPTATFTKDELLEEAETVLGFIVLSRRIVANTKGKALADALDQ